MLSRWILVLSILSVSLAQAGCGVYPTRDEYATKLASIPVSGDQLSELDFQELSPDDWLKFELGGDSKARDFGGGMSFFASFELPAGSRPATLEVRSKFNHFAQARGHVVWPTILVLDAKYSVLHKEESEMRQSSAPDGGTEFAHEIVIGEDAKYAVVYADPGTVDRKVPWYFSMYIATPVSAGGGGNRSAAVGVGGPMRIKLISEKR